MVNKQSRRTEVKIGRDTFGLNVIERGILNQTKKRHYAALKRLGKL